MSALISLEAGVGNVYLWSFGQNYTCGAIFRPVSLQTTENGDMGSPMLVLNHFLGLIWHHHSNPWSKLFLWCDFQTCTLSDHKEEGHGVLHGGPEQLIGADLISSYKYFVKPKLEVWFSDLHPFRPQRTWTWGPPWWSWTTSWGWSDIIVELLGQNYTCGVILRPLVLEVTVNQYIVYPKC